MLLSLRLLDGFTSRKKSLRAKTKRDIYVLYVPYGRTKNPHYYLITEIIGVQAPGSYSASIRFAYARDRTLTCP